MAVACGLRRQRRAPPLTPDEEAAIVRRLRRGDSYRALGALYNRSHGTIYRIARAAGIRRRP